MKKFIDYTVFMGMHCTDDNIRVACKNFIIRAMTKKEPIYFSLEQIGKCDDIIWSNFSNSKQAEYYPFMDNLHSLMNIKRKPYSQNDFIIASTNKNLTKLPFNIKMMISQAITNKGVLYTVNQKLIRRNNIPVKKLESGTELKFPKKLEQLYQRSLSLRISHYMIDA
jgi:hypothetical protein